MNAKLQHILIAAGFAAAAGMEAIHEDGPISWRAVALGAGKAGLAALGFRYVTSQRP